MSKAIFILDTLGLNALRSETVVQLLLFAETNRRKQSGQRDGAAQVVLLAIDGDVSGSELIRRSMPLLASPDVSFEPMPEPEVPVPGFSEHQRVFAVFEALKQQAADEIHFADTGGHGHYLTQAKRCGLYFLDTTLVTLSLIHISRPFC